MKKINIDANIFDWFKQNMFIKNEGILEDNILKCFLNAFPNNITYYDASNNKFNHIINNDIMTQKIILPRSKMTDSSVLLNKYVLYLAKHRETHDLLNLNNIKIEWL